MNSKTYISSTDVCHRLQISPIQWDQTQKHFWNEFNLSINLLICATTKKKKTLSTVKDYVC